MHISGEYYSYYMVNNFLAHHGVLGMKWGQHIFGNDEKARGTRKSKKVKRPSLKAKKQDGNSKSFNNFNNSLFMDQIALRALRALSKQLISKCLS